MFGAGQERRLKTLKATQSRLQQKLTTAVTKNNWEIAKIFISHFGITLNDINQKYHYSIKTLDSLFKMPGFDFAKFTVDVIFSAHAKFIALSLPNVESDTKKAIQLTNLLQDLTTILEKAEDKKFEVDISWYNKIGSFFNLSEDLNTRELPLDIKLKLAQNTVNYLRVLRDNLKAYSKDSVGSVPEIVSRNSRIFHRNLAGKILDLGGIEEPEIELEKYNKYIQNVLRENDPCTYYSEREYYLFMMCSLSARKEDFDARRYYFLSFYHNARKGFRFGHAVSDALLLRIYRDIEFFLKYINKKNVFDSELVEEVLFSSRIMKELVNKSQALHSTKKIQFPNQMPLTLKQLQVLATLFGNINENVKRILWEAMEERLTVEVREFIELNTVVRESTPVKILSTSSSSSTSNASKNISYEPKNIKKNFTIKVIDPDFLSYLYRALKKCEMSFVSEEENHLVRITNFYPHKMKIFPQVLEDARLLFIKDKNNDETIESQNTANDLVATQGEFIARKITENPLETSAEIGSKPKSENAKKLSAKAEAIIAQNQKMQKHPDVIFNDTLKYSDKSEEHNVFMLRETKGHHIYATIDPALIKELKLRNLGGALEDLETMLDVGHVLNNSKGLRGSILSGKPFKNEKQPEGKELYVKVKNCSHDFRFFGYATHQKKVGAVNCTLLTINGWKEKHNKKSELFASIPEESKSIGKTKSARRKSKRKEGRSRNR